MQYIGLAVILSAFLVGTAESAGCHMDLECLARTTCMAGSVPYCRFKSCACTSLIQPRSETKGMVESACSHCLALTDCAMGYLPTCELGRCTCAPYIGRRSEAKARRSCSTNFQCLIMTCFVGVPVCRGGSCTCSA